MLYVGIDQHGKQLTISVRDEDGSVLDRRQVSTRRERVHEFFDAFQQQSETNEAVTFKKQRLRLCRTRCARNSSETCLT